ncbi:MAG: 4Fe-4S binding protein [Bacteroidales bacterium]|jgi:ferredoxin|nr:4Fe-4S binding protein [Bacteroidales bacterium]
MKKTVTALDIRTVSFIIALICAIPGMWKGLQGFHVWFSLSFNTLCSRCGNCIRACPARIIHPLTLYDLPLAWMTPVIRFEDGYCLETCNVCSRVCPTGAIELFPPEAKKICL